MLLTWKCVSGATNQISSDTKAELYENLWAQINPLRAAEDSDDEEVDFTSNCEEDISGKHIIDLVIRMNSGDLSTTSFSAGGEIGRLCGEALGMIANAVAVRRYAFAHACDKSKCVVTLRNLP
jgi:hypothetical protein